MTKAQQLGITQFPYEEYNSNGKIIYSEDSTGFWFKQEFDSNGNEIYAENSNKFWYKKKYDSNGNLSYYEDSDGYWIKRIYDSDNNEIYYEDSDGCIEDNRLNKSKLRIVRTSDKQIFEVKKYIYAEGTEHHVWCDEWYGRHVIGQDCEWVN